MSYLVRPYAPQTDFGKEAEKFKGTEFKDGNYNMDPKLWEAAVNKAEQLMKDAGKLGSKPYLMRDPVWQGAADLDGKEGEMTKEELAAMALARSMATKTQVNGWAEKEGMVKSRFTNTIDKNDYNIPHETVLAMAKQIFAQNAKDVGPAKDTPDARSMFINQMLDPKSELERAR